MLHPATFSTVSALVQKHIVDRNGTPTTRWVKPEGAASPTRTLPAPAPVTAEGPSDAALARFADHAAAFFASFDSDGNFAIEDVARLLRQYSRPTMLAIASDLKEGDGDRERGMDTAAWIGWCDDDEESLRDLLAFSDVFELTSDRGFKELAVNQLSGYGFLPKADEYSALPAEQVEGIRRILGTTEVLLADWYDQQEGAYAEIVLPEDLARLVYDRPADHRRINELVADGITEPRRIEFILGSGPRALSDGAI